MQNGEAALDGIPVVSPLMMMMMTLVAACSCCETVEATWKNYTRTPSMPAALLRLSVLKAKITPLLFGGAYRIRILWWFTIPSTRGKTSPIENHSEMFLPPFQLFIIETYEQTNETFIIYSSFCFAR